MRSPRGLSLRLRLVVAGAVAVVLALALAGTALVALFATHVERRAGAELTVHLDQLLAGLDRGSDGMLVISAPPADPRFGQPYSGLYWQIESADGLIRSRSLWDWTLSLSEDPQVDGGVRKSRLAGPQDTELLVMERAVTVPQRLGGGSLREAVAMDTAELAAARDAFAAGMMPYLAVLAAFLILAAGAQVAVGLRPLSALGSQVAALRAGAVARMGGAWPSEVRPLASEIDALLDEREQEVRRARARAADLAHGLKTPLQALMGEADRLRDAGDDAAAEGIEEVAAAMRRIVDWELARARAAAAQARDLRTPVASVAEGIVSVLRRTPEGAGLDWRIEVPVDLAVRLDEADLSEALGALAENAARYGTDRVGLVAEVAERVARISVVDDGPGIPESRRTALTDRFARADESRARHGLGLAIAAGIAEAAGGRLTLADAGPGLVATLELPVA
ncbi:sensor histidine kinase [Histidinibacterium lentulum]|uniref:histidine kinase n=1 Tax=Histidinibacterium lentulum TaxID=2480588 RepID=A0A3N2QW95_9RHOB|nr:HAMP domain-containing sensor histidine kinase [Histidinibacterium lentulum]ROT99427.1 sensor histidine kinase [Histidinibacterium lentulum]